MPSFSERHGYANDIAIVTREAPTALRTAIVELVYRHGMKPSGLRRIVCDVLFEAPNKNNWSETPNIDEEVRGLLQDAAWYDVYDVVEKVCSALNPSPHPLFPTTTQACREFEAELNRLFRRRGIGWQIRDHRVEYRGDEGVAVALEEAPQLLVATGRHTAATELHEAVKDLSRRPKPEVTGAIQHAMAALECVARDLGASKDTLGALINRNLLPLPLPLPAAIEKLWGYASNHGRHIQEGHPPTFEEAELVVGLCAVTCQYLARKDRSGNQ